MSYTDIETDRLLEMDLVTLDEALKTANDAVLLAINAVSVLTSVSVPSLDIIVLTILILTVTS